MSSILSALICLKIVLQIGKTCGKILKKVCMCVTQSSVALLGDTIT